MNYQQALERAYERAKAGLPTTVVHPFLPFPIKVDAYGKIMIGFFKVNMSIGEFIGSKMWRCE